MKVFEITMWINSDHDYLPLYKGLVQGYDAIAAVAQVCGQFPPIGGPRTVSRIDVKELSEPTVVAHTDNRS